MTLREKAEKYAEADIIGCNLDEGTLRRLGFARGFLAGYRQALKDSAEAVTNAGCCSEFGDPDEIILALGEES
jgi:hypothetical protein